jgi:hypothetical protein
MCKIISVDLLSVPKEIHVGDNNTDITVVTKIEFHPLDIQTKMEYCLHIFVYDVHGALDAPLVIPNWDESTLVPISTDRKDVFLGREVVLLSALEKKITIETPMALRLGKFGDHGALYSRKLEVFATVAPVIGRASKWSKSIETHIMR